MFIDIKDLDLYKVFLLNKLEVIIVGKYLCGEVIDFVLKCVLFYLKDSIVMFRGLVIVLCCYYVCKWFFFVNILFFEIFGFSEMDFGYFIRMTSWVIILFIGCTFYGFSFDFVIYIEDMDVC